MSGLPSVLILFLFKSEHFKLLILIFLKRVPSTKMSEEELKPELSEYEQKRVKNIERNNARLRELGLISKVEEEKSNSHARGEDIIMETSSLDMDDKCDEDESYEDDDVTFKYSSKHSSISEGQYMTNGSDVFDALGSFTNAPDEADETLILIREGDGISVESNNMDFNSISNMEVNSINNSFDEDNKSISNNSINNEEQNRISQSDDFDFCLLLALLSAAQIELQNLDLLSHELKRHIKREEIKRKSYYKRKNKDTSNNDDDDSRFPSWKIMYDTTSNKIFRKKFRMSKELFTKLCTEIRSVVGDQEFRPEAAGLTNYLCGEVRLAIAIRLLAGASYLEFVGAGSSYNIQCWNTVYRVFHKAMEWINRTFEFPLMSILKKLESGNDEEKVEAAEALKKLSAEFGEDSMGVFNGCFGAIDGLAIRIECPRDVLDPGNYFSRKNFYALSDDC